MRLRDMEVRPGKVREVVDNYGTVKASCAGLFSEEDATDLLPPIIPLFKTSSTSYCMPHEGDAVLVWFNTQNPQQLYYTFQGDVKTNNQSMLEYGGSDIEILSRHDHGESGQSTIMYNEGEGWSISDDDSSITVSNSGGVSLQQGDQAYSVSVTDSGILMTSRKSNHAEPAVLGDKLEDALNNIYNILEAIQQASVGNPYTSQIASAIGGYLPQLKNSISQIKSDNVKLN